ncbi:polyprotein [Drepanopeziza brunnea f. sp. 'multigermtubi' MB_m1]|uniref:Polyprotein n=1 Tax=Marssonina brunnea f. sp. multigermtubi (strain MB_m1) TaxID=1072389 RepID=K1XAS8_MARBU|nr:polyprotein [Drepanopeziza brunnea f. sp. 'multigermtubi' MB_m1]EKD17833.1 polyprotein [Drepanopeziza brunnea f. sp. 'multigermtubi' MB_m1]
MKQSSFDSCLFMSTNKDQLRIAALQTDNILIVVNPAIKAKEEKKLVKFKLRSKEMETFTHAEPMIFNRCKLSLDKKRFGLSVKQKGQDLKTAKLFVFVDGAFANNADLSSQIGFVAILSNKAYKCKRVTRAVLAFELYAMSLIKLRTTKKKRLMIDIIAIRELYERRELSKVQVDG